MHKLSLLLVSLILVGCGLMVTPTSSPTPKPTAAPTPAPRYYPTADAQTAQELQYRVPKPQKGYFSEITAPNGTTYSVFSLTVISSGKVEVLNTGDWILDVVWVYERNNNPQPGFYPLVVGVVTEDGYVPYYTRYTGEKNRDVYLKFLEERSLLERGRYLYPSVGSVKGGYVSLYGGINWQACGDDVFCRLGRFMQETYALDEKVTHQMMGSFLVPEGWALAWVWDAATEEHSDPEYIKIDLP